MHLIHYAVYTNFVLQRQNMPASQSLILILSLNIDEGEGL